MLCVSQTTVQAIGGVSKLVKHVARRTSTAELLATVNAADKLTFTKHLLGEALYIRTPELVLSSGSSFHLCSIFEEAQGIKNKISLASIWKQFLLKPVPVIRCTPKSTNLVDSLTNRNQEVASQHNEVLASGNDHHSDSSYVVTT